MTFIRLEEGQVLTGVGSCVVINDGGWILTAAHVLRDSEQAKKMCDTYKEYERRLAAEDMTGMSRTRKDTLKKKLRGMLPKNAATDYAPLFAWPGAQLVDVAFHPRADLAIGRLDPFDPASVHQYPTLKDPANPVTPGTSLCRTGFPFSKVNATFDAGGFQLNGPLPPLFPIEGMMCREVILLDSTGTDRDNRIIETSTPSLKGQSGGPLFDTQGTLVGINSSTRHYPLGFNKTVKHEGEELTTKNAFLHVGWAVHPLTIRKFLDDTGIAFSLSAY